MVTSTKIVNFVILISSVCLLHCVKCEISCVLQDDQRTPGICVHIRDCKYQLERYRLGISVTNCGHAFGQVCCPVEPSISEKKCSEWREFLHRPLSYSQPRFQYPLCANSGNALVSLITAGLDAYQFEYPHAVTLGYGTDRSNLRFLCGATLISESFLITTAHCVVNHGKHGRPSYALVGDINLVETVTKNEHRKLVKISQHILHPRYKAPLIYDDIALLSLETPLELSRYLLPACLGNPLTTPVTTKKKRHQLEGAGWGGLSDAVGHNLLRSVNVATVDRHSCNAIYNSSGKEIERHFIPEGIKRTQFCANSADEDTDICWGDEGGGIYLREGRCLFHLIGIATKTDTEVCGLGNKTPGVYTTVASHLDWIQTIVWGS